MDGYEIHDRIYIHMKSMTVDDISTGDARIPDPEHLISTTIEPTTPFTTATREFFAGRSSIVELATQSCGN
ncbi:hypothetical protein OHT20_37520 [Streptomyces caniferus]|uniref:Uncharacterized protein n=1 Tax=Streptomyces caniferus TaxID=285557 RepID=A0ABZ1VXA6_9ACTN|nr:hypothetical protein [Streptomyces caniferus]